MGYHYGATPKGIRDGLGLYGLNPLSKCLSIYAKKAYRAKY